jgi:hypothetical protein
MRSGQVSPLLRYEFALPNDEPLLWLPDIVAGTVTKAVGDDDPSFLGLLDGFVDIVNLP